MSLTVINFLKRLSDSGVWTPEELAAMQAKIPVGTMHLGCDWLAAELVQRRQLTQFQADALRGEKPSSLSLGNYVLEEKVGSGAIGVVYKARHRRMNRVVAVKLLKRSAAPSPNLVKQFLRDAKAAAELIHPNIVAAYDADEVGNRPFLVMEFVDGINLAEHVRQHGGMDFEAALDCMKQVASGLEYAHQQGVIHRDIKPANILVDRNGTAKILEMGLAKLQQVDKKKSTAEMSVTLNDTAISTQTSSLLGAFDFMSPEQAINSRYVDFASDIYSLGATLFFLITGRPMYEHDNISDRILDHRSGPIPSLCGFSRTIPLQVDWIFHKMVAKTRAQRYKSMSIALRDLTHWKKLRKSDSEKPAQPESGPRHVPKAVRPDKPPVAPNSPSAAKSPPVSSPKKDQLQDHIIDAIFDDGDEEDDGGEY